MDVVWVALGAGAVVLAVWLTVALVARFRVTDNAAFWDGIAEKYAKQPVANREAFDAKIAITKSRMKATDVVLDIGCGTGSLALRLAGSAAEVHGLDISSEMTRIANGKARAQEVENVTFHTGAFDETFRAFEAESLDGICAYSLLHLVDDRSAALAQIFRLLKPGGFFISSTVCLGESWVPYGALIGVMRLIGKAPMVKIFDKRTLEDEIRQSGFVDISQPDVGAKGEIAFVVAKKPDWGGREVQWARNPHDGTAPRGLLLVHLSPMTDLHDEHDVGRLDAVDHAGVAHAKAASASEAVAEGLAAIAVSGPRTRSSS